MIEVGHGTAKGKDSRSVGQSAASQAMANIREYPTSVVLVFASVYYDLDAVLDGVREAIPYTPIIGASTAGEICDGLCHQTTVVTVLASSYLKVRVGIGQNVSSDYLLAVNQAISSEDITAYFQADDEQVYQRLQHEGSSAFALVFSPGNTRTSDSRSFEILEELKQRSKGLLPICGAGTADDWQMQTNYILWNQRAYPDGLLVSVFETKLRFGMSLSHGFRPSKKRVTVTKSEGHTVLELDGRRAEQVYTQLLGFPLKDLQNKHLTLTTGRPVGMVTPQGEYIINVASFFTNNGGIRFAHPVIEGTTLVIMDADPDEMIESGIKALYRSFRIGSITQPAVALVFSCALRNRILGERMTEEIDCIRCASQDAPVVGFLSFGEQGIAEDGSNYHGHELISLLSIGKSLNPAAQIWVENQALLEEHQQTEEALSQAKEEWERTFDAVPDIIFLVDQEFCIIRANRATAEYLGISVDELIGSTCYRLIHGTEAPPDYCPHVMTLQDHQHHETESFEKKINCSFHITSTPLFNANGNFIASVHVARDITQRRMREEQLRRSETLLRETEKLSKIGGWEWHVENQTTYWTDGVYALHDLVRSDIAPDPTEYVAKSLNCYDEQDRPAVFFAFQRCTEHGQDYDIEVPFTTVQGRRLWVRTMGRAVMEGGRVIRVVGNIMDITERKKAEESLARRAAFERLISEISSDFIALDTKEIDSGINSALMKIGTFTGADRAYVFLFHDGSYTHVDNTHEWCSNEATPQIANLKAIALDEELPWFFDHIQKCQTFHVPEVTKLPPEAQFERKHFEDQDIQSLIVVPMTRGDNLIGFLGFDSVRERRNWTESDQALLRFVGETFTNIIERKHAGEKISASLVEKEVLLREIHHRVKNNMQTIVSLLRMQSRRIDNEQLKWIFGDCQDRINAMALIHESLYQSEDLARINFHGYLKKLCHNLNEAHNAAGSSITIVIKKCSVALDLDQSIAVGMVISELVSNAFKHAFPEDKAGKISISVCKSSDREIQLIVQDNGIGLPPDFDIENPRTLGLRLAVATITHELSGCIKVERSNGTCFIITFGHKQAQ